LSSIFLSAFKKEHRQFIINPSLFLLLHHFERDTALIAQNKNVITKQENSERALNKK
jgi:hypothetical protein